MDLVWRRFPGAGTELLLMLALADFGNESGQHIEPSIDSLAHKLRVTRRQAQRVIHGLIDVGWLRVVGNEHGGAPGSTRQYEINLGRLLAAGIMGGPPTETGDVDVTGDTGVTGKSPESGAKTGDTGVTGDVDVTGDIYGRRVTSMSQTGDMDDTPTGDMGVTQTVKSKPKPLPPYRSPQFGKRGGKGYPHEFEHAWAMYPKRIGNNPKAEAFRAWQGRIKAGADPPALLAAARRYAHFCAATDKTGTELVMQASRFYGRDEPWQQDWELPIEPSGASHAAHRRTDHSAIGRVRHANRQRETARATFARTIDAEYAADRAAVGADDDDLRPQVGQQLRH